MMRACFFLILFLLVSTLYAAAPHPCSLELKIKESAFPVVGMKGSDPIILDKSKQRRYRQQPNYDITRTRGYGEGAVEFTDIVGEKYGMLFGSAFEFTITSKETLNGAFIAFLVFDEGFLSKKEANFPSSQIVVHDLPDLPAGKPIAVRITAKNIMFPDFDELRRIKRSTDTEFIPGGGRRLYVPVVFAPGGLEIRSDNWERISNYFQKIATIRHTEAVARYREHFGKVSRSAAPFVAPPPVFPEGVVLPTGTVTAMLTLNAEGTVDEVVLKTELDQVIASTIRVALRDWLFFPPLRDGEPVPIKVQIPLKF